MLCIVYSQGFIGQLHFAIQWSDLKLQKIFSLPFFDKIMLGNIYKPYGNIVYELDQKPDDVHPV